MPSFNQTYFTSVASGGTLSDAFPVRRGQEITLDAMVPTSCAVFLRTGDVASAGFLSRAWKDDGSAAWSWLLGASSGSIRITNVLGGAEFAAIETGVALGGTGSFAIVVRG